MEHETRSMVGLLYVLKDEKCGKCKGSGTVWNNRMGDTACFDCDGRGFRTFKIELSDALRRIKGV